MSNSVDSETSRFLMKQAKVHGNGKIDCNEFLAMASREPIAPLRARPHSARLALFQKKIGKKKT